MLRVWLARHGETDWNRRRRLQGRLNVPLNSTGWAQASQLAKRLATVEIDAIYTSCLGRSMQTASALQGRATRLPLSGLDERGLGVFEGCVLDGRAPELEDAYRRRSADPEDRLDGGESWVDHGERVWVTFEMLRARHAEGNIVVVGHGGTNRAILRRLLDLGYEQAQRQYRQRNGEVYLIEVPASGKARVWTGFERGEGDQAGCKSSSSARES